MDVQTFVQWPARSCAVVVARPSFSSACSRLAAAGVAASHCRKLRLTLLPPFLSLQVVRTGGKMRPPSPLLILLYITLSKSLKVVSKRGSGIYPSPSESLKCVYYMKQSVYLILCSMEVVTNSEKRMSCWFEFVCLCVSVCLSLTLNVWRDAEFTSTVFSYNQAASPTCQRKSSNAVFRFTFQ